MRRSKRLFDIAASTAGLVVLSPLLLLLSLFVKGRDGGDVLFVQERVGRGGRTFRMLKFRTMRAVPNSASANLTVGNDPRITAVGKWLRLTKLDELPQLLNVLRGEMTFVGPRPEVPSYAAFYDKDQRRVLDFVPGITDPASLKYWNEAALLSVFADPEAEYVKQIMPAKIQINLAYASCATFASDLRVIFATLSRLLLGRRGAALTALPA
ncbi:MAG TPA: sugar transferase, partial [Gemmatimonadaceae bacterium]|nr:sugar transferase [Gemmatimonadaceae bacterium]